ncbi:MAG: molybdenum cofactor guanylyltransferase MobA [Hyphomicrobiales bacterium]|nr:molybdenum cofactor guanylyltransferase MobA [Hyphomicrobiales bacterium]
MAGAVSQWRALTVGVALAGGLSRRMGGGDKSLKMLGGRTMLAHTIERLEPQVGRIVLNANGDPERFAAFAPPVVADPVAGFAGPLAGVLAGFDWTVDNAPEARWIVTAATDTPFFPGDLVSRFVAAAGHHETMIALAKSGGNLHPVFGLWPVALADDLRQWLTQGENRKVLAWVDRHEMVEVEFPGFSVAGELLDPFFNANTPDDMKVAEAILQEMAA